MKKIIALSLALAALTACSSNPSVAPAARQPIQSLNTNVRAASAARPDAAVSKRGQANDLRVTDSKGEAKTSGPLPVAPQQARNVGGQQIIAVARMGMQSMDSARTYQDGYNAGVQALQSLASQDTYMARLGLAASSPEMKYESAYKVVYSALTYIASGRENTIPSICDASRQMMDSAKTYDDGARIGYAVLGFIRPSANSSIQFMIDSSVRTAQASRYWEDAYRTLYSSLGQIRNM